MSTMQQYHEHGGQDIKNGRCEYYDCKFRGLVKFNADYMYVCDRHRKIMNARNTMNSKKGTYNYKASEVRTLREKADKIEKELPELKREADQAEFKFRLIAGK